MKKTRKYMVIIKISLANAVAYRWTALSRLCFYVLVVYVLMSLWRAIYQESGLHGYSYGQIVWYLVMTEFITLSSGSAVYRQMNEDVKSGAIAYLLGRPVHYVFYQLSDSIGQILFNALCFGILALILGFAFAGPLPGFQLTGLPFIILSVVLGFTLNCFIMALIGLSAFVFEDNFALYLIYQKLTFMLGMLLPVEFLPAWLQPVVKSMPFSYVHWAPAKIFVDFSPELCLELIPRQAAWAAFAAGLVFIVYSLSVRRLQVNGG